ncbi:MAG: type III pantothenate kinase [Zetaproteobacteria bacterium]|nr:type III pantothenate kinase [Flavobacteriales bacterium]
MNLGIDIGNSSVKVAVFEAGKLIESKTFLKDNLFEELKLIKSAFPIKNAILSTVTVIAPAILIKLKTLFPLKILSNQLKLPYTIAYKTLETLGLDRIALVASAVLNYPNQNVLVIDAGTCITFDFITEKGVYLGGAISPGIQMRYNALHTQTAKLPQLKLKYPENFIGNSTDNSIHSGVCLGTIYEIKGVVAKYKSKYRKLTVVLTGGNTNFLAEKLKSTIFANSNFLLEGLNFILNFNLQE